MDFYFISGSLPNNYGGLTKSLLLRSKLFGSSQQTHTHFLTFGFDLSFRKKVEALYKKNIINPDYTNVINLYEDFLSDVSTGKRLYQERKELDEIKSLTNSNKFVRGIKRLLGNNQEQLDVSYHKNNTIRFVRFFNHEQTLIKKEEYCDDGRLSNVSHFEPGASDPYLIEFINRDNIVYLEKLFTQDETSNESTLSLINWYSDQELLSFIDESDLRRHWIRAIQLESDKPKLFLVDSRAQDKHVFEVKKDINSFYAAIIHNKHYGDNKYHIKGRYKKMMAHRFDLDAVFFITNEQLEDFTLLTGVQPTHFYTPHTIDRVLDRNVLTKEKNPHKAVIISRLAKMKNFEDAVSAFVLVVKEIPSATLEIYGTGDEERIIKEKIAELKMNNHIFLKGHTSNPDAEFQTAALTISTSHFEGFGLSNMEALGNGCPVVTYDYDYGARSLVKDGVNGYIVEQYNIKALASKIVELMNNEEKHDEFAEHAFESASTYTPDHFIKYWSEALNQMIQYRIDQMASEKEYKKLSFEMTEIPTVTDQAVSFVMESNQTISEDMNLTLIGIDRNLKEEIARVPIEKTNSISKAQIDSEDFNWHAFSANNVKKIDFYVELKDPKGVVVTKRISSTIVKDTTPLSFPEYELESYSTKYKNYSWSI